MQHATFIQQCLLYLDQHKRSFQRKTAPEQDRNVKMEILDERKEHPRPVDHESGVVKTSKTVSSTVTSGNIGESANASRVAPKATNPPVNRTLNGAMNVTSNKTENISSSTNKTSSVKTNTTTSSPESSTTTKKPLTTEEDDDLEGGFNDSQGEKNPKTKTVQNKQSNNTLNLNNTLNSTGTSDGEKNVRTDENGNTRISKDDASTDDGANGEKAIERKANDNFIDFNVRPDIVNREKKGKDDSLNLDKVKDVDLDELDQA